ncbi:hypothetical protein PTSG_04620 [Salpingoeca rosetta]|uniref:Band 7 domain-containing protein n=1 Tax=Salpingoeca rosetta (strain ATCC 50818 / BSB-021) TaxID=946362 RepID=F2U7Y6_SALR5|nr:uncharacterized protein PTSG_04620 [Salpingoeca rosetta]EGD72891.1 hypothetical protein PTSG_04620 [Salpingoeca rosetta]|eukprot:XP_004994713.1 hypothetical protein PTSG_04620 [Salpingoeca rosetta]
MQALSTARLLTAARLSPRLLAPTTRLASSIRKRRTALPMNTGINFVPQQEAWVIERFGKFFKVLDPGLQLLIPLVDEVKYVHSLKEIVVEIPSQSGITQDNVTLHLDGVLYLRIVDPYKASYGVEDAEYAVAQLAQTTMRSELGKLSLDNVFRERQALNEAIVDAINDAAGPWGVSCMRCEIRDIMLPDRVVDDMQRQVSAERKKRAAILESEGSRASAINVAEGKRTAVILASEANRRQQENIAEGEAAAIKIKAEATAQAVEKIAAAIQNEGGKDAVALTIAQQYVEAFAKLAKENNTMLLPANMSDPASMIAQCNRCRTDLHDALEENAQGHVLLFVAPFHENGKGDGL